MVLVQKWAFLQLFFLGTIAWENVPYGTLQPKNAFLDYKNKKSLSIKIDIFPKGLIHGFGLKMAIFNLFFMQFTPGKCLLLYSRPKKRLSRPKKQEV